MLHRGRPPGWNDAGDLLARALVHVVCLTKNTKATFAGRGDTAGGAASVTTTL